MKKIHLFFDLLLVAVFLTFSVVNIASSFPIETWDHKLVKKVGFVEMNDAILNWNKTHVENYQKIVEEYWTINKTEVEEDDPKALTATQNPPPVATWKSPTPLDWVHNSDWSNRRQSVDLSPLYNHQMGERKDVRFEAASDGTNQNIVGHG